MNNKEFKFLLFSADGKRYESNISILNVHSNNGSFGIMKNHLPFVSFIDTCYFSIDENDVRKYFAVSEGILRVDKNKVVIIGGTFEPEEELDRERILKKKEIALRRIVEAGSKEFELKRAELSLKKALNRLSLLDRDIH